VPLALFLGVLAGLLDFIRHQFRHYGIRPGEVAFEITETAAMSHFARANAFIRGARELGCAVALDDFGSGYSSLGWLRRLPVQRVKMDRAFVAEIDVAEGGDEVTRSVIALVHARPDITTGGLIEHFADREEGAALQKLAGHSVPGDSDGWRAELLGAIEQLNQQAAQQRLAELQARMSSLDEAEKLELRELLKSRLG
jgi:hypothetical protein